MKGLCPFKEFNDIFGLAGKGVHQHTLFNVIVIDNLIVDITKEYGMTTVVISHDMNSVIEASDTIHFLHHGEVAWAGENSEMMNTESETLNDFIYASKLMQRMRKNI